VKTPPAGTPHNWTIAELLPDLHHVSHGRSFQRGKEVFSAAGCINCHKMGDEGKGVGPDLTLVRERLKPEEIVREIIEPSSVINPEFEGWVIETHDYDTFIGVIVKEDDNK